MQYMFDEVKKRQLLGLPRDFISRFQSEKKKCPLNMPHNSFSALQIWWLEQPSKEGLAPDHSSQNEIFPPIHSQY